MKAKSALSLVLAAGFAGTAMASTPTSPLEMSPASEPFVHVAHIYFNIMTGERVITVLGDEQTSGAGAGESVPIWTADKGDMCSAQGYTSSGWTAVDNNGGTTSFAHDHTFLDWGDIALDSVVDMVHVEWLTAHADVPDSNGIGEGVVGLAGEWSYWDADNGRAADRSTRLPLLSFMLIDLPGNVAPEGFVSQYTVDIDLVGSFSSSASFEIGDSDGDSQGAAFANSDVDGNGPIATQDRNFDGLLDSDLDSDGLFDFAWSIRFAQPGTRDLDGDGNIDGDIADSMENIGIAMAVGEGTAIDNGDGTWAWEAANVPAAANGQEDVWSVYGPPAGGEGGPIEHSAYLWFLGLKCEGAESQPFASFRHGLFGPGGTPCPADINGDESLNFFDISAFLGLFSAEDPQADFDGNGSFNFFDISAFLAAFSAGCDFPG